MDALLGNQDDATAREILLRNSRGKPSVKFTSVDMDPTDLENGQILHLQQRIIDGKLIYLRVNNHLISYIQIKIRI